jgi:hypothetical protein
MGFGSYERQRGGNDPLWLPWNGDSRTIRRAIKNVPIRPNSTGREDEGAHDFRPRPGELPAQTGLQGGEPLHAADHTAEEDAADRAETAAAAAFYR